MERIAEIQSLTTAAIVAQDAVAAAAANERSAEVDVLNRILEIVRPAVNRIGRRPRVSRRYGGGRNGLSPHDTSTRSSVKLVCLSGDTWGPEEDHPRDNDGDFEGTDFGLAADGSIVRLTYSGTWSRWQGSVSEWSAAAECITTDTLLDDHDHDLSSIVEALIVQLERAAQARPIDGTRASKLRAVLALL